MHNDLECQAKQATIYVSSFALATATEVQGLDECDRDMLATNPETDLRKREGYYLSIEAMRLEVLPVHAEVAVCLSPAAIDTYCQHVSFPPELRGLVFIGAPNLPENYSTILRYWSPLQMTENHVGAQHCQNLLNEYPVPEIDGRPQDALLSNGVAVCIRGVLNLITGMRPDQYIEIRIPVDAAMLGMDREKFDSAKPYGVSSDLPCESIFLKVQDILQSPDSNLIAIAVLHTENHDSDFNF